MPISISGPGAPGRRQSEAVLPFSYDQPNLLKLSRDSPVQDFPDQTKVAVSGFSPVTSRKFERQTALELANRDRIANGNIPRVLEAVESQDPGSGGAGGGAGNRKKESMTGGVNTLANGYAAVKCDHDDYSPRKRATTIKCKPNLDCHKLREYHKEHHSDLSPAERTMLMTAMAEMEKLKPKSRLANCELTFMGPDPNGHNPTFVAGDKRNKYLLVWREESHSAELVTRSESCDPMSATCVKYYAITLLAIALMLYLYCAAWFLINFAINKLSESEVKINLGDSSVIRLKAGIIGATNFED